MHLNGDSPVLPTITLAWDQETQSVRVQFGNADFKNWDFVIACLDMAKATCEQNKRIQFAQQLQQQALETQQSVNIARKLKL